MAKKIRIYSTPTCVYCMMAKKFFEDKGIKFENIDVSENEKAAKEMVEKSNQMGVPVIEIDGKIIVGFDEEKIQKLL